VDGVRFIDELLLVAAEVGEIQCSLAGDRELRFQTPDRPAWDVTLDRAKTKLRMLCARLGVLCNESGGPEVSLYGGEGVIRKAAPGRESERPSQWAVRFMNTPDRQGLIIQAH
jgi:hypothetical protein